jgi:hypothetical protein
MYSLGYSVSESIQEALQKTNNPLEVIGRISLDLVPKTSMLISTAEEAVQQKQGNCFAFAEVVATVADEIPDVKALITLDRGGGVKSRTMHANCIIVSKDNRSFEVNRRTQRPPPYFEMPWNYAVTNASVDDMFDTPPRVLRIIDNSNNERNEYRGDSIEETATTDLATPNSHELFIMTPDIGILTLRAISRAGRLWRNGEIQAYNEHRESHPFIVKYFDVRKIGGIVSDQKAS